jgi:hypothetical protein
LLALLICNGFAAAEERRLRAITFDIVVAGSAAAITQLVLLAMFHASMMLTGWCPSEESALSWFAIILLRAIFPPGMKMLPTRRWLA